MPQNEPKSNNISKSEQLLRAFDLPPKEAVKLLEDLGIDTSGNWDEMMKGAEARGFVISRVVAADVLQDMKDELERALAEGTSFQEFKKNARDLLARRGWTGKDALEGSGQTVDLTPAWRLELIYRQNLQTSMNAGRFIGQLETINTRPYLEYSGITDKRQTDLCKGLDGVVLRADDPFWLTSYPPNHMRCRSRVTSLSEREIARSGIKVADDKTLEELPSPDKGFDRSPLAPFKPDTTKYDKPIKEQLTKALKP